MPMKDNVTTWVGSWHEQNFDLLAPDLQQKILSEHERLRLASEAEQRAREASLDRLVASVDVVTSTAIPVQHFYTLDRAVDITARSIIHALHDIPPSEAHTSEYWADTLAKHQVRLRALVELGRLAVFDVRTAGTCVFEHGLPDWAKCSNLGLTRSGVVDFARCQGVEICEVERPERVSTKKQRTMLKVIAALIHLRNQPKSHLAIAKEIENWTESIEDGAVTARTVTSYIKEIEDALGLTRQKLGLSGREDASD
ncbi:hypothetical protein [Paraburkholderia sp. BL21I4N1]|uniref:hypothetical protein n=1 Tax=Paraburkholderia sp. BL21I4N1 TaxID=1938801 RepID=UPI000CFD278D|nr:hypothetical protein [Paraburkholderia sp. BL21I4N1]PQV51913.1 hypothetical protein B0G83_104122 [Paraburkholderia sp. BL21I4N1]